MTRPTIKELREEIEWLTAKLGTATGFTVPLTDRSTEVFADSLIRLGNRFAIVRHRPFGAQAYIGDQWVTIHDVPAEAFAYDAVEAHRLADLLIVEEVAQDTVWHLDFDVRPASDADEHLAEFASEVA